MFDMLVIDLLVDVERRKHYRANKVKAGKMMSELSVQRAEQKKEWTLI